MGQALVFGLIGSSALVIGGAIGAYWRAPHQISGVLLAFASGTLISALAFELFPEAVHLGGLWPAGLGLIHLRDQAARRRTDEGCFLDPDRIRERVNIGGEVVSRVTALRFI